MIPYRLQGSPPCFHYNHSRPSPEMRFSLTKFRGLTLAAALLALAATLTLGGCGQAPIPEPIAQTQPVESTSPPPTTPLIADATPASRPSPSPTPESRPTSVPSPSPTSTPSPTTTSTSTPSPTTTPRTPTPVAITATPTPTTTTPAPTASPTTPPPPPTDDPYANLNIITLLPKDGIPAILDPTFIDATKAWEQYLADEPVLGVSINGEHKAYSVPYLSSREIVNDELGGVAIAATW